ncbi:short chain dehydrogenase [Gemmata obscuriglobus]|nr:short chain dehydrogenase [Gemmata obscuriglobus]VTS01276.1 unnamed protein product [Gemmata obscuriglobus UQM 2246]
MVPPNRGSLVTGGSTKRVGSVVADARARRGYALAVHDHTSAAKAEVTAAALCERDAETRALQADMITGARRDRRTTRRCWHRNSNVWQSNYWLC